MKISLLTITLSILLLQVSNSYRLLQTENNMTYNTEAEEDQVLTEDEVATDSKQSISNCSAVEINSLEYIDCVINNLSLEFFFTAYQYYKKKFNKVYETIEEEMRRFKIFTNNYKLILR